MEKRQPNACMKCCRLCASIAKWTPVVIISAIIVWSYYAYVVAMCAYTVTNPIEKALYLIVYHPLYFIFLWSYIKTIFTKPMTPPRQFNLSYNESEEYVSIDSESELRHFFDRLVQLKRLPVQTRAINGVVRFCERCHAVKPDRTHHCSTCGVCLLKMDHHCPWVNNCVGFHNYKFFVIFLLYGCIYCLFIMSTSLQYFIQFWTDGPAQGSVMRFHLLFLFFTSVMFAVSLFALGSYHIWLTFKNRSTLESFRAPIFHTSGPDKDGFHLGAKQNFLQVFGEDPKLWFLPIFTAQGSGVTFPVRRVADDESGLLTHPDEDEENENDKDGEHLEWSNGDLRQVTLHTDRQSSDL